MTKEASPGLESQGIQGLVKHTLGYISSSRREKSNSASFHNLSDILYSTIRVTGNPGIGKTYFRIPFDRVTGNPGIGKTYFGIPFESQGIQGLVKHTLGYHHRESRDW